MQIKTTAGEFSGELEALAYSFNFGVCRTYYFFTDTRRKVQIADVL